MKIKLKLFASLGQFLPAGTQGNMIEIDIPEGTSPNQVLALYDVPMEMVHLVLRNGNYVESEDRGSGILQTDDELALWPPVAGG